MSDETHKRRETIYRIFIRLGQHRHYAGKIPDSLSPRVNWWMLDQSYPDTFTKRELNEIIKFYDDQRVEYYKFGMRDVREKEDA